MSRSVSLIQQQILDQVTADPLMGPFLAPNTSKRAIFNLWAFIVATAIAVLEQLIDIFSASVELTAASAAPATANWLQNQIFKFQYSASNPQVIQLINFAPSYPVVDPTLNIITRCSVNTTLSGKVVIKVATGNPPAPLSAPQIAALGAYINPPNGLGIAGVIYNIVSLNPDQLFVAANIFYQGQYSSVIQLNVINAINAYLAAIPFNGQVRVSDLEGAIKAVPGVNDVVLVNVVARPDAIPFGSGTYLVQSDNVVSRVWNTAAGYLISEQTVGNQLANTLTFTAE